MIEITVLATLMLVELSLFKSQSSCYSPITPTLVYLDLHQAIAAPPLYGMAAVKPEQERFPERSLYRVQAVRTWTLRNWQCGSCQS